MAQFDVFRHRKDARYPYLLDLQADLLCDLATHVVAPLTPLRRRGRTPIGRLNPTAAIDGEEHAVLFQELAAFPTSELGAPVANLRDRRDEWIAALDLLFTGI